MTRTEAKDYILHHPEGYLKPAKKRGTYICPLCGNGTGSTGDGLAIDKSDRSGTHLKCFRAGCEFYGDMIELIARVNHIQDGGSREAFEAAYKAYGLTVEPDQQHQQEQPKKEKQKQAAAPQDYTEQYTKWNAFLLQDEKALAYLESRGIKRETAEKYMLGYCPEWSHPSTPQHKAPRIIFPRTRHDYTARRIDGREDYRYMVVGNQGALFNAKNALKDTGDCMPVVVVEGELDALTLLQDMTTEKVIGLGTAGAYKALVERAKLEAPGVTFILALDNDEAGIKAQKQAVAAMQEAGLHFIDADPAALYGEAKDANEAARKDADGFFGRLMDYMRQGWEQRQRREEQAQLEAYYRSGAGAVDFFLQDIQSERYRPISTGIRCLDVALNGGLVRQTLVIVGAAPAMGKTALVSQISENLAEAGEDVLYINLEMSRQQLLSRSLARIANGRLRRRISSNTILRGYAWTEAERQIVEDAAAEYKEYIADHLIYNPGQQQSTDLDDIMKQVQDEQARIGRAPIVVLDYLQLLTGTSGGKPEDDVSTIKRAVLTFKRYAIENNTIVLLISANNRASMKTGESDIFSGRDTSAIEFSADMHLGIEYRAIGDYKDKKTYEQIKEIKQAYFQNKEDRIAEGEYRKYCCQIAVRVNKNRFGEADTRALLFFDGASTTFTPLDTYHMEPPVSEYRFTGNDGQEWELLP